VFAAPRHDHTRRLLRAAPRVDKGEPPNPVTARPRLSAADIGVDYDDLRAVNRVSFSVKTGETLAVVGESGSGKSSLVRAVLGLVPSSGGRVIFARESLDGPVERRPLSVRRDLQLVYQDPTAALNPQMRVQALVEESLIVHEPSLGAGDRRARVIAILNRVGLGEKYLRRFPHELSGGQAQRVAIARALVLEPKVLVCDEAVAALDGSVREQVLEMLREVQRDTGLSIIFISHDLAVVRSLSHRVLVMYMGRLVELADSASLFATPRHPYTRALLDSIPVPDPVVRRSRAPLRGEVPSLVNQPPGCVFHPRCPKAEALCSKKSPPLSDANGTRVACHFPN
jgi:oligopeptide/dipeptide ABC transporter ATP-binding protein